MPDVLFCDEPTGNLDSRMSGEIYDLLKRISNESGMSVVVVSHQEVGKDFFHSEYAMKDGKLEKVRSSEYQSVG
jgi:putative ABC transport system ATP-binding protein